MIPLNIPNLSEAEAQAVAEAIRSGWVSTAGPAIRDFEAALEIFTGTENAIACNSGTAALHLILVALEIGYGDMVIIPDLTYVATANAISYTGAEPVLCDVNPTDGAIDALLLEKFMQEEAEEDGKGWFHRESGKRIRAVVAVWQWGFSCHPDKVKAVTDKYGLHLIEDAAAAMGSFSNGSHAGTIGIASAVSFNGNKIMTTGGGGAVFTDNSRLAARIRHLSTQARVSGNAYFHDTTGFNYRMTNLSAALGIAQMNRLQSFLEKKKAIFSAYAERLEDIPELRIFPLENDPGSAPNSWQFLIHTPRAESLIHHLRAREIEAAPVWAPLHLMPMFHACHLPGKGQAAGELHAHLACLPSSTTIPMEELETVCEAVTRFFRLP